MSSGELSTKKYDHRSNVKDLSGVDGFSFTLQFLDERCVDFTERYAIFLEQTEQTS